MCRSAAQKLIDSSWDVPMLELEDVFWTGIVAQKAGLVPFGSNELFHYYQVKPVDGCMYSRIISSHMCKYQDPNTCNPSTEIHKAHKAVMESGNCSTRTLGVSCSFVDRAKEFLCQ